MSRGTKRRQRRMPDPNEQANPEPTRDEDNTSMESEHGGDVASHAATLHEYMKTISQQITELKTELKSDFDSLKEDLNKTMKTELNALKQDINQQLAEAKLTLQDQGGRLDEAEKCIEALQTWATAANNALKQTLLEQKKLSDKLHDQESRARRNNIRIYGVPEGEEGASTIQFVDGLIRREKLVEEGTNIQIQRAHRSLGPKPPSEAPPRSLVVNFLQFTTKETVLRNAWRKKISIRSLPVAFDHDYMAEVVQQRRAYKEVKSALKAKGIRFQSPYTKLRVHWDTGTQTYSSPGEAARELQRKGFEVNEPRERAGFNSALLEQLDPPSPWQRVTRRNEEGPSRTVRERLQEFQYNAA